MSGMTIGHAKSITPNHIRSSLVIGTSLVVIASLLNSIGLWPYISFLSSIVVDVHLNNIGPSVVDCPGNLIRVSVLSSILIQFIFRNPPRVPPLYTPPTPPRYSSSIGLRLARRRLLLFLPSSILSLTTSCGGRL
jgi:hypothetical protein